MSLPFVYLGLCFENISIHKTTESGLKSSLLSDIMLVFNDLELHNMFTTQPHKSFKIIT